LAFVEKKDNSLLISITVATFAKENPMTIKEKRMVMHQTKLTISTQSFGYHPWHQSRDVRVCGRWDNAWP